MFLNRGSTWLDVDFESNVPALIPASRKIQAAGKCLIIDGFVGWEILELMLKSLDTVGTLYHLPTQTVAEAQRLSTRFDEFFAAPRGMNEKSS